MKKIAMALMMLLSACSSEQGPVFKIGSYKLVDALNDVPTTVTFSNDGKFNGKVVNYLMGSYNVGKDGKLSFGQVATTMMMGADEEMEAEQNFLQILPKVKSFKMQGNYLVLVLDNGGELLFEPYTPTEEEK